MKTELKQGQLLFEEKALFWIYIFSFVFDYKGQEGGSLPQYIMAGLSLAAGTGFILFRSRRRETKTIKLYPNLKKITILWWFYLLSTILTGLIAGVVFERYIRIFFPLLLCGISLLIICKFQKRLIDPNEIIKPLLLASLIAVLWKIYYAIQVSDIPIYEMRYQIVTTGGSIFILSYVIVDFLIKKRFKLLPIFAIFVVSISGLLSITRSLIITLFFLACGYLWVVFQSSFNKIIKRAILSVLSITLVLIPSWYIGEKIRPGITQAWIERIFYQHLGSYLNTDITLLTRLAEWCGQWQSLTSNKISLLFGRGLGSEYFWAPQYFSQLAAIMSFHDLYGKSIWSSGHSMWVYSIYSGGLLFGWIVIAISFLSLFRIMVVIQKMNLISVPFLTDIAPLLFFVILGFISQGFTSNPLGMRLFALIAGVVFGMIHWLDGLCKAQIPSSLITRRLR